MIKNEYVSPLTNRYGSDNMRAIFSDTNRHRTWRKLWYILAKAEKALGLDITEDQLYEMRFKMDEPIDYNMVRGYERDTNHDVMAHLKEFCHRCPKAEPIIHLGATSCYIVDNTDIKLMESALRLVRRKLQTLIDALSDYCEEYAGVATMAYTHLQPAQPTTVGKRGCMWLQDFVMDCESVDNMKFKMLGCNGATGTQASFVELFDGDENKVSLLNEILAEEFMDDKDAYMLISGQTYTRKVDSIVLDILSNIAQSAHKMCNDIRLLQGMNELCEPFSCRQVGSSAMAYKRNPIKCENVCSLSRHIIGMASTSKINACTQWLERSLDDSANRRLIISESFILIDHILNQCIDIIDGIVVNKGVINRHIKDNIPFVAMENIIMDAVKSGISRQEAHSRVRDLSMIATSEMLNGGDNKLLEMIKEDSILGDIQIDINPDKMIGMAKKQTMDYLSQVKSTRRI